MTRSSSGAPRLATGCAPKPRRDFGVAPIPTACSGPPTVSASSSPPRPSRRGLPPPLVAPGGFDDDRRGPARPHITLRTGAAQRPARDRARPTRDRALPRADRLRRSRRRWPTSMSRCRRFDPTRRGRSTSSKRSPATTATKRSPSPIGARRASGCSPTASSAAAVRCCGCCRASGPTRPGRARSSIPRSKRVVGADGAPIVVSNPIVGNETVLRTRLLPGLLGALRHNEGHRNGDLRLFEVGRVFARRRRRRAARSSTRSSASLLARPGDGARRAVALLRALAGGARHRPRRLSARPAAERDHPALGGLHPARRALVRRPPR